MTESDLGLNCLQSLSADDKSHLVGSKQKGKEKKRKKRKKEKKKKKKKGKKKRPVNGCKNKLKKVSSDVWTC